MGTTTCSTHASSSRSRPRLPLFLLAASALTAVHAGYIPDAPKRGAFSFTLSEAVQCGPLTVTWQGGQGPYHLITVPWNVKDSAEVKNISIPTQTGDGPYSYTFDFHQAVGQQFVATMYDSTGWGSGGVSSIQTVAKSDNSSCLTPENKDLPIDGQGFWMEPTDLTQVTPCSTTKFAWNEKFAMPASIYGLIPNGDTIQIPIKADDMSVNWLVNAEAKTPFVFVLMTNGKVGNAGSLAPFEIGASTQNSCLDSSSPGVTGSPTTPDSTTPTSQTGSANPSSSESGKSGGNSSSGSSGSDAGTIAGAAVGSAVGALLIAALVVWCYLKRRKQPRSTHPVNIDLQDTDESSPMRHNAAAAAGYDLDQRDPYLNPYPLSTPAPSFQRESMATSASELSGSGSGNGSSTNLTEKQRIAQNEARYGSSSRYQQSAYALSEEIDSEATGPIAMPPPSYDHVLRVTNPSPAPPPGGSPPSSPRP